MESTIVHSARISRVYLRQDRIAELNQKHPVKSVQGQEDRVTISSTAQRLLQENQGSPADGASVKGTQA